VQHVREDPAVNSDSCQEESQHTFPGKEDRNWLDTEDQLPHSAADERSPEEESLPSQAKQLKERIPGLALVNVRWIQWLCKDKMKLPSRKMVEKPLFSQRMKDQMLPFAMEYQNWGIEQWRDVMFSDKRHFELHFGDKKGHCRRSLVQTDLTPKSPRRWSNIQKKVMIWGCFRWQGWGWARVPQEGENDGQPEVPEGA
jgi:hypothetical protein